MQGLERYFGLRRKVALLTGATGGIGRAMAEAFACAGAALVLTSNEADTATARADTIATCGRAA